MYVDEVVQALSDMKDKNFPGLSDVSLGLIAASREIGIHVMTLKCLRVVDGFGMPVGLALSVVVPIFKGNCDIRNCHCYRALKLLEHGMKVVEMLLERCLEW